MVKRRKDKSLMRIMEKEEKEIRNGIGIEKENVVEEKEEKIMKMSEEEENIVIGKDEKDGEIRIKKKEEGEKKGEGEGVIGMEDLKMVKMIVKGDENGMIRKVKIEEKMEIIGRIGKDEV